MQSQLVLFFFSAIGVFNTFLISIYLIARFSKRQNSFDLILGLFLFVLALRVGVSCIYFFDFDVPPWLVQLGLSSNVFLGPLLWTLIRTGGNGIRKSDLNHLNLFFSILLLLGLAYPMSKQYVVWDWTIRFVFHALLAVYIITTGLVLLFSNNSNIKIFNHQLKKIVLFSFVTVCIAFSIALIYNYILGPLLFSVIFYTSLSYYQFLKQKNRRITPSYSKKKIPQSLADELSSNLDRYLEESKIYKRKGLKVENLASNVSMGRHELTQLLNDNKGVNFSDYINGFRVEEAKSLLLEKDHLTMEGIGYESGFNSKTSFFNTFKKFTGKTPKEFRDNKLVQD